jgi:hydroxypyruvate reductase
MTKPDLLLLCPIYAHSQAQLEANYTCHKLYEAKDVDAFVAATADKVTAAATSGFHGMKGDLMRRYPKLKTIACFGVGYDGIDIATARELSIAVTNTPDVLNECVADTAWTLILSTVRKTAMLDRYVRAGKWLASPPPLTDKVWGEKLGIVGLGRIGKSIAKRAEGFGMTVCYHGRNKQDSEYKFYPNLVEMAKDVKVLLVITPGGKATEKIISKDVIDALGTKGYLINVSRGTTVDEAYLVDALVNQRIGGAGLDVFVDEPRVPEALFALDNVVLQPHVGSGTFHTRQAMGQLVVDNLAAHFAGKALLTAV